MRPTMWLTTLGLTVVLGCSGSGTSTTARTDTGSETGDSDATADPTGDPSTTGQTTNTTSTTTDATGSDGTAGSDGSTGSDTGVDTGSDTGSEDVTLEGEWLSEGENIAPLLVQLVNAVSISATFDENTFNVVTLDGDGQEVAQTGVYTVTASGEGEIFEIVLEQSTPTTITAEGIYEIDNSTTPATMRYEVVQTEPDVGALPPTAEGGFGSTAFGSDLTQVFVRQ